MKTKHTHKTLKQGFTLLELLVVVIIIGILAAIALPQYQMAVGKAKYAELKTISQSVATSLHSYHITHGSYTNATVNDLDITIPNSISCTLPWQGDNRIKCCKKIFNTTTCLYRKGLTGRPQLCLVYSADMNDKANRLCQKETRYKTGDCNNSAGWCQYYYY